MRAALKSQDANVAGTNVGVPAKHTAVPINVEMCKQQPLEDEERDSMRAWRQRWRAIMKESIIYFDGVSQQHMDKLKSYLAVLGSTTQLFFDQKVTHVISDNHRTELASRAKEMGLKVYTVEKLARFLSSLLNQPLTTVLDANQSAKLAQMLEKDSRMSAFASSNYRKEDVHYFKGPYVLVWDPTMYNRPLVLKEWKIAENSEEGEWPQLRRAPIGISPFAARAVVKAEKRKFQEAVAFAQQQHQLRQQQGQQEQQGQQQQHHLQTDKNCQNEEFANRKESKRAECEVFRDAKQNDNNFALASASTSSKKRHVYYQADGDKENHDYAARTGNAPATNDTPMPAQLTNSIRLREFGEIVASGVPRYSATSNRSMLGRDALASREMTNLRRKVMPKHVPSLPTPENIDITQQSNASALLANNGTPRTGGGPQQSLIQNSASASPAVSALASASILPAAAVSTASTIMKTQISGETRTSLERRTMARPKPASKKPGYCENCLERYDDLSEHLVSKSHRQFAATESKFASLDRIISLLRR